MDNPLITLNAYALLLFPNSQTQTELWHLTDVIAYVYEGRTAIKFSIK